MASTTAGYASYITIDSTNRLLNILSTTTSLAAIPGSLTIKIRSTLATSALYVELTSIITLIDPCATTTITTQTIADMSVTIGGAAATRDFAEVADS